MVGNLSLLPQCPFVSAQAAASDLFPKPAGALRRASRLAGSSDRIATSRGRATSPPNRAGKILVARNGSCPLADNVAVPIARLLDCGWTKGSPLIAGSSPPFGGYPRGRKCTISVSEREARGIIGQSCPQRTEAGSCLSGTHAWVSHG